VVVWWCDQMYGSGRRGVQQQAGAQLGSGLLDMQLSAVLLYTGQGVHSRALKRRLKHARISGICRSRAASGRGRKRARSAGTCGGRRSWLCYAMLVLSAETAGCTVACAEDPR
jgi:hypothetical protein